MPDYIMTVRSVCDGAFTDQPGGTTFLKLADDDGAPFDPARAMPGDDWVRDLIGQVTKTRDATGVARGDVLVFIHGYNNAMAEVLLRHRLLEKNLAAHGFAGSVVSFDWPCDDIALAYLPDRERAKETAFALVRDGIRRVARLQSLFDCDINLHLLAHSTGAYVVQEAFDDADDRATINAVNWTVSQIALIAGDVAAATMAAGDSETRSIFAHCVRLTNYANANDEVLQLSNVTRAGAEPRVGRVGLPEAAPPSAVNVDCSRYYSAMVTARKPCAGGLGLGFSHSWQFDDPVFAQDLAETLNGDVDRGVIATRGRLGVNRFELCDARSSAISADHVGFDQ